MKKVNCIAVVIAIVLISGSSVCAVEKGIIDQNGNDWLQVYVGPLIGVVAALLAVFVGYYLGEMNRYKREQKRIASLKNMINKELESILAQIPQKNDIVNQIIKELKQGTMLPATSVGISNTGYVQHIPELYEHLPAKERNCLHVIYERLRVADEALSSFEHDFPAAIAQKVISDPFKTNLERFEQILESYEVVVKLINSYLEGNPIDVFYIDS